VPALIIVKVLDALGGTQFLASLLEPVMRLVGLPAEIGIVWAAAMLTSIYTSLAVFADMSLDTPLTIAQASVLGTMILVAHTLPVEGAVARATGVPWAATLLIRIGGALAIGSMLNAWYTGTHTFQEPAVMLWRPEVTDDTLAAWALAQLRSLAMIFVIIVSLMALLRILKALGVERLMHALLAPLLRVIGIGREATNVTIIGFTLGISIGAGLLIREARTGGLSRRDIFLTMAFLGLCHSVIEDTLLILLLGADLSAILWTRLAFAIAITAMLARIGRLLPVPQQ
jgi:spore maturation protein SpmB